MDFKDILDADLLDEDNYDELLDYYSELNELDILDDEAIMAIDGKFDDIFLEGSSDFKKLEDVYITTPFDDLYSNNHKCPLCGDSIDIHDEDHILTCNRNKVGN